MCFCADASDSDVIIAFSIFLFEKESSKIGVKIWLVKKQHLSKIKSAVLGMRLKAWKLIKLGSLKA